MADYYDRLEAQLATLTERGAHRRRRPRLALPPGRFGFELVAVVASVLVVVVVAAALLSVGTARHASQHHVHPATHGSASRVLLDQYPAPFPAPPGGFICQSPLTAPRGGRPAHGMVRFYSAPPTSTEMFLTANGLRQPRGRDVYAVWMYPAVANAVSGGYQLQRSHSPQLVGVIESPSGVTRHLTIADRLAQTFNGAYRLVISLQPHGSLRAPGSIALAGFIDF